MNTTKRVPLTEQEEFALIIAMAEFTKAIESLKKGRKALKDAGIEWPKINSVYNIKSQTQDAKEVLKKGWSK